MHKEKRIKAVFFDIDGTLYPCSRFAETARRNAVKAMVREGLGFPEGKVYLTLAKVVRERGSNYGFHFNRLLEELGLKQDPRLVAAAVRAYHETKAGLKPFPKAKKTLAFLKRSGLKLFVASEGVPVKQWDKLIRLGLHRFFDGVFVCRKKTPSFFRRAVGSAGFKPSESVMVGDRLDKDVVPAAKSGLHTVLITKQPKKKAPRNTAFCSGLEGISKIISSLQKE